MTGNSTTRASRVLDTVTAGFFCAVMALVFALADASLLFGTTLPGHLMVGVAMALAGFAVFAASIALRSQFRGCVGGVQESMVIILATMVAGLADSPELADDASGNVLLVTSVAMVTGSTLVMGLCLWLVGRFRAGRFIRFVPYPVVGGFLAGTALLLIGFALALGVAAAPGESPAQALAAPQAGVKLGLTIALAGVLTWLSHGGAPRAVVPAVLVSTIVVFVAVTHLGGTPIETWLAHDWMLTDGHREARYPPIGPSDLALVRWDVMLGQLPQLAVMVFIGLMGSLVTVGTLETTLSTEVDHDRELQLCGSTNLLSALAGGLPGNHALAVTTLASRLHGDSRAVGVIVAAVCIAALLFAGELLALVPRFVFGALLLWVSVELLGESLLAAWRRHGALEFAAIASIATTVVAAGFLPGIVAGLVAGTALFVLGYSRIDVVRRHCTGSEIRSTVDRSEDDRRLLDAHGGEILVLALHGYLFFGSAHPLIERLKRRTRQAGLPPPHHVLIDFDRVSGVDSTARQTLARLRVFADEHDLVVLVSAASASIRRALLGGDEVGGEVGGTAGGAATRDPGVGGPLHFHDTLDEALERAENASLGRHGIDVPADRRVDLDTWLGGHRGDPVMRALARYMEPLRVAPGDVLLAQGARANGIYLVCEGRLDVRVRDGSGGQIRVRQIGAGSILGEVSTYLDRTTTASVTACEASELLHLSREGLSEMLADDPELASRFHERMAALLARRLVDNGHQIRRLSV